MTTDDLDHAVRMLDDRELASWRVLFARARDQRAAAGRPRTAEMFSALAILLDDEAARRDVALDELDPDHEDDDADWTARLDDEGRGV